MIFIHIFSISFLFCSSLGAESLQYGDEISNSSDRINFLCHGDWGWPSRNQTLVAKQLGLYAESLKTSFIIALGDNFYPDGVESDTDPQWQSTFETVYKNISHHVPWYAILGNHDYHKNPQAQIDYYHNKRSNRWIMPDYFYEKLFFIKNSSSSPNHQVSVHIIFINTPILAPSESSHTKRSDKLIHKQLQAIEQMLEDSTATWRIVVGHYPVFSTGEHGDTAELVSKLLPLLQKNDVDMYINGHDHTLQHISWHGIDFVTSGHGAMPPEGWFPVDKHSIAEKGLKFASLEPGFASITVSSTNLSLEFVDKRGRILYKTTRTKDSHAIVRLVRPNNASINKLGGGIFGDSFWILSTLCIALFASVLAIQLIKQFTELSVRLEPACTISSDMEAHSSLIPMAINSDP